MGPGLNLKRLIAFAQDLVRQRSVSGEEGPAVQLILAEMQALGFEKAWVDGNGSAIGVIDGSQPGPTLLLDAHCDTVGIAPGSHWTRDPYGAEIEGDCLYGRGAADMKGALAAMVHAAGALDRSQLAGRVVVSATVMEEVMEGASLRAVVDEMQPDFVIIGEATGLNLNRGGRGRAEIHLETIGKPAHSSAPQLGVNAVHKMMETVRALEAAPTPCHPLLGPALLALTDIFSDPYPGHSVIPSRCRVTYDRRLLPGETPENVLDALRAQPGLEGIELQARIAEGEYFTYTGAALRGPKFFPAWEFDEALQFVQRALQGLRAVGLTPQIGAYRFCTNAAYSAGIAGIPTLGFGPAAEGDAHVVDEQIQLQELEQAARGYLGIIDGLLASAKAAFDG